MQGPVVSRRTILAAVLTAVPLAALAAPSLAGACAEWCDDDPGIVLTTPDGERVPAHVTLSGRSDLIATFQEEQRYLKKDLARATITSSSQFYDTTSVLFTVTVTIPNDATYGTFDTKVVVSSGVNGTGTVYAAANGTSGTTQTLQFIINNP